VKKGGGRIRTGKGRERKLEVKRGEGWFREEVGVAKYQKKGIGFKKSVLYGEKRISGGGKQTRHSLRRKGNLGEKNRHSSGGGAWRTRTETRGV